VDNLAHGLLGAALAETGLKRATPLATATLVIGANLPDIDAVTVALGSDAALLHRRGWTHGVLAMAILPFALTGAMLLWDRLVRRRRGKEPARAGPLLALSFLSVLSHPLLDLLNTYGVRLLMPFDGRWFYGDTLFIVDPWLWLVMAAAVVLARGRGRLGAAAWIVLGAAASALVLGFGAVPFAAKAVWLGGVGVIVALRLAGLSPRAVGRLATGCVVALAVYVAAMAAGTRAAVAAARERQAGADAAMAGPVPADPLVREGLVRAGGVYRRFVARLGGEVEWVGEPVPHAPPDAVVERALAQRPGLRNWLRYPAFRVEPRPDGGFTVRVWDLRYVWPGESSRGIGAAVIEVEP
jgi:inner membrane protein